MKKKIIYLLLLSPFLLSINVFAANWVLAFKDTTPTTYIKSYIDINNVVKDGNHLFYWEKSEIKMEDLIVISYSEYEVILSSLNVKKIQSYDWDSASAPYIGGRFTHITKTSKWMITKGDKGIMRDPVTNFALKYAKNGQTIIQEPEIDPIPQKI